LKLVKKLILLGVMAATAGCDQVTKHIAAARIDGIATRGLLGLTVRFQYAENTGGFLSLGASLPHTIRTSLFVIGTAAMLLALLVLLLKHRSNTWMALGLSLALTGGASNLFDRIVQGSVVDFIDIGVGSLRTGIFNVADVAILLGLLMVAGSSYRSAASHQLSS
jgi:signal peptidase II